MNFKFNRKPLKEKIYKWYVCGYYDINARGVEDNLTTNDVEEAKDFAWELVNRGDFVVVKNMHNGKSAIVNEDDVFDDVSEYLNDIFRSIDGRTNESLKEDANIIKVLPSREYRQKLLGELEKRLGYAPNDSVFSTIREWDKYHKKYGWTPRQYAEWAEPEEELREYVRELIYAYEDILGHWNDIMGESLKEDTVKQNNDKYNRVVKKFNSLEGAREFKSKLPKGAEARIDYFDTENKDGSVSEWWEVCYWENRLKEDISDYEIDKVYKKLSKLNKVDFGALEDEYLKTRPSLKDAVYKFYGTILNTKSYCKDFVKWAKEEKGIDLKGLPCKESYRRR